MPSLGLSKNMSALEFNDRVTAWYEVATIINHDQVLVGGWVFGGSIILDVVTLVSDEDKAIMLGKMWEQVAIGRLNDDDDYEELALAR